MAAPAVLLEEPLPERTGARVGVLLRPDELGHDLGWPGRPAETNAGEERLRERPRLDHRLGRERPEARGPVLLERELPVGDVLQDENPEATRQLDESLAPLH